ncbi:DUF3060 domain-containing protein [Mycobacterium sp. URHB0044]|jgi:hypothetical protein|uniref:DUF3060 domain-containing protein n=1 Tax=Mycobacterium sp. URHB0044 TaxID=1380386 RepID=UPI0006878CDE|nr:DUF3060 domain-containing protein [Mycobacterium sp. URHB0044]
MNYDDPEKRIAELERQLREARAHAGDGHARRFAEALQNGFRTDVPNGSEGPSGPDMAQIREGLARAAAQAGMSQAQLDNALQHATVTFRTGHSVVYTGQDRPQDGGGYVGMASAHVYTSVAPVEQTWFGLRKRNGKFVKADLFGGIVGLVGSVLGAGASLPAMLPSSALWTSALVCGGPNQLIVNTSQYSSRPSHSGTSINFQCMSPSGAHDASWETISAWQSLAIALVVAGAFAVGLLVRRRSRHDVVSKSNAVIAGSLGALALVIVLAVSWFAFAGSFGATQMPHGGNLTIKGNGETKTIACNDGHLTVEGREMTVEVVGHCSRISVDGVIHHVTVDSADAIDVNGLRNTVIYHSGSPQISGSAQNSVQQG